MKHFLLLLALSLPLAAQTQVNGKGGGITDPAAFRTNLGFTATGSSIATMPPPGNDMVMAWNNLGVLTPVSKASLGGGGGGNIATDTLWDAAGDLTYGTGSNTATRLAIGIAGQILQVNSGATAPEWTSTPSVTTLTATTTNATSLAIGGTTITASGAELNYTDGVTSAIQTQLDAKVDDSQLSTTGGANKVPQLDSNGNQNFGTIQPAGGIATMGRSLILPSTNSPNNGLTRLWWLNDAGTDGGSILYNPTHSGSPELQINGPRIALCLEHHGLIQLGLSRSALSTQSVQLQTRGDAESGKTTVRSLPIQFNSRVWNGTASIEATQPFMVAEPTGTGTDVNLDFYNPGVAPNEAGAYESGTLAMRLSKNGLSLPTQTIADANAVITKPLGDARYMPIYDFQSTDQTFTQNSTGLQDTEISITLAAATTYKIEVVANYTVANQAHGVHHKLTYSGTMSAKGGSAFIGNNGSVTVAQIFGTSGSDGYHNSVYLYNNSNIAPLFHSTVVYTTTTGGTLKLQGAQAVAGASNSVLRAGTWITATPLP